MRSFMAVVDCNHSDTMEYAMKTVLGLFFMIMALRSVSINHAIIHLIFCFQVHETGVSVLSVKKLKIIHKDFLFVDKVV